MILIFSAYIIDLKFTYVWLLTGSIHEMVINTWYISMPKHYSMD